MNKEKYRSIINELATKEVQLVAVSKTRPIEQIEAMYDLGQRVFGENRPKELKEKAEQLPYDVEWHMIGHLQRKNVKYIAPYVHLIHSINSIELLQEIDKRARQNDRVINCLLQIHIAQEEAKSGFSPSEFISICKEISDLQLTNIRICGVMGMATFTDNKAQIHREFTQLKKLFEESKPIFDEKFKEISMGMSGDYKIAVDCGSSMVRIGSLLFNS